MSHRQPFKWALLSGFTSGIVLAIAFFSFMELKLHRQTGFNRLDDLYQIMIILLVYQLTYYITARVVLFQRIRKEGLHLSFWQFFLFFALTGFIHFWVCIGTLTLLFKDPPSEDALVKMILFLLVPSIIPSLGGAFTARKKRAKGPIIQEEGILDAGQLTGKELEE